MRGKRGVKLKYISVEEIKDLVNFIKDKLKKKEEKRKRGRPKKYSDAFILMAYFLKIIKNLSYRELVYWLEQLKLETPTISDLYYRFSKIPIEIIKELFRKIRRKLIKKLKRINLLMVDGTGFGYDEAFLMKWLRGALLRRVKSHVKTVIFVISSENYPEIVYNLETAPAYSDERKLALKIMNRIKLKSSYLLADSLYGMSIKFLKKGSEISEEVVVPIKDGIHNKVRNKIRKEIKEAYRRLKEVYKKRYKVEQVIGKLKNSYGDREMTRDYKMAEKFIWLKFIAYNYSVLLSLQRK